MYYNESKITVDMVVQNIYRGVLLFLLTITFINAQAAPLPPDNPELVRINALPGYYALVLSWNKHPQESDVGFGYVAYYYIGGDVTNERVIGTGMFEDEGTFRRLYMPGIACYLALERIEQDVSFRLKAFNTLGKSPYSDAITIHLAASDLTDICPPEGLTVTINPAPTLP